MADVIIWVVKHAREEHKAAIEWLNNHTDEKIGFFLCEIKLYRIGDSEPAVKFEVIEKPNDWTKEVKKSESANVSQIQTRNELDVELYISEDKELFHSLFKNKDAIESDAGLIFDWRELPERKASRIVIEKNVDFGDRDQWSIQFDWLIEVMIKMKKAFRKYL